jgi:hypothetical protein
VVVLALGTLVVVVVMALVVMVHLCVLKQAVVSTIFL